MEFRAAYDAETVDYVTTALPYLLSDLTPSSMRANEAKLGWLTHEYDAASLRRLVERALELAPVAAVLAAGQ